MKKLIVNADDFGLTKKVNDGIINAHNHGIVTSASIVANGEAFDHAVSLCTQHPDLTIGIHLVFVEEKPVSPMLEVSSLLDKNNKLYKNYKKFFKYLLLGKIKLLEIEKESRAQIEKILAAGINISHIDSHQHIHLYPTILAKVIKIAKEYHIEWIRNSFENSFPSSLTQCGLSFFAKRAKQKIVDSHISTTDYFFGSRYSGCLTENRLLTILSKIPFGLSEIMCHPGEQENLYEHWHFNWEQEKSALISPAVKNQITKEKIELTSYANL